MLKLPESFGRLSEEESDSRFVESAQAPGEFFDRVAGIVFDESEIVLTRAELALLTAHGILWGDAMGESVTLYRDGNAVWAETALGAAVNLTDGDCPEAADAD